MKRELHISEQLAYSTVRIECLEKDGQTSTGTGFFYEFEIEEKFYPALVTNKHVISNATEGRFILHTADENGNPIPDTNVAINISNFERCWVSHPDKSVDLCIMPTTVLLNEVSNIRHNPFLISFGKEHLLLPEELTSISAMEDIVMVGYPNGIWDSKNNMPIFRRGITATHPFLDYEGRKEFLIDAACFPGSSGSPIFMLNMGSYSIMTGGLILGSRFKFIGILYAGPQHTAAGDVIIVDVPTTQKAITVSRIPNNLGVCIKAYRLLDFLPVIKALLSKDQNA
jgi:hypothetical protein